MIKETVQAVGVTHIVTESGSKILLGNRQFEIGESVWTHGNFAFGTERNNPAPLILPTGIVPAEPGHYIVEFNASSDAFKIRDVSNMQVVAEIPAAFGDVWPPKFCYDAETLKFCALSEGPSDKGYNGVTIHTIQNGIYTTEWVDFPSGGYFSNITCRFVNHELTWTAFVNNLKYNKWTKVDGTSYDVVSGVVALYEYIGTELQNTYDYTSRVNAICDEAWGTINTNYNDANILSWVKSNEQTYQVGDGITPIPYTDTEFEVAVLRRPARGANGILGQLGTYNSAGNTFYPITSYGPQYPRMTSPNCSLVSFEEKLISVGVNATCYLYLGANRLYGNADNYYYQYILNGPFGQLQTKRYMLLDGSNDYTVHSGDTLVAETWNPFATGVTVVLKLIDLGNSYGENTSAKFTVTYNGPNTSITNTYNGEWQQPLDYGYCVDVGATGVWNGYNVSFDYTAAINDGGGWTHDITNDFGYNPISYPDFLSLDNTGNILYYTGSYGEMYKIDKAIKALTLIHDDALYSQMQMSVIEGFKDAIVASLTIN